MSCGHDQAIGIDNGIQGTRLVRLAPEPALLAACNLSEAPTIKRHHFATHMIMFTATVLQ